MFRIKRDIGRKREWETGPRNMMITSPFAEGGKKNRYERKVMTAVVYIPRRWDN